MTIKAADAKEAFESAIDKLIQEAIAKIDAFLANPAWVSDRANYTVDGDKVGYRFNYDGFTEHRYLEPFIAKAIMGHYIDAGWDAWTTSEGIWMSFIHKYVEPIETA